MTRRENLSEARWHRSVQYRHACSECGEVHLVAVISYHGDRVRLCRECFLDGFWRDRAILEKVAAVRDREPERWTTYVRRSPHHPTWHIRRGDGSIQCDRTVDASKWWVGLPPTGRICARCQNVVAVPAPRRGAA